MAEQTWTLTNARKTGTVAWTQPSRVSDETVNAGLLASPGTRYVGNVSVVNDGACILRISDSSSSIGTGARFDLSDAFETNGQVEIVVGSNRLVVAGPNASGGTLLDPIEPYAWRPSNQSEVIAFYNAVSEGANGTVTLRDFTPVAPAFTDPTGDAITGTVGEAIAAVTVPAATGTPAPTYAAVGTLPAGVSFDTGTRVLSFDENAIVEGSGTIRIRATNSQGSADWTVAYTFAGINVYFGNVRINRVYFGAQRIERIYRGNTRIV